VGRQARKNGGPAGHNAAVVDPAAEDRRRRFEAVVAATYVPLQRFLRRRTDPASADDLLGDVLLVMWRRADDIPADAELAWCYGVARGCLANSVRARQRHLRLLRRLAADRSWPPPGATDEDPRLHDAMRGLSATDLEILRLWAWEDLAPREIALVLGISANAASIRLHRATKRLRARLAGDGRKDQALPGHEGIEPRTEAPR
jgi:RNA polymerase sigma-70 factor, ECF subfamily